MSDETRTTFRVLAGGDEPLPEPNPQIAELTPEQRELVEAFEGMAQRARRGEITGVIALLPQQDGQFATVMSSLHAPTAIGYLAILQSKILQAME